MCDPVKRPLQWNKNFYVYMERHGVYDVIQALMKELAIWKPKDPLSYIKDEIKRIGASIYAPKVFMIGQAPITLLLAEGISNHCGAKFLTLESIIQNTTPELQGPLEAFLQGGDTEDDEPLQKLLIATIARRIVAPDCIKAGYVIYGFPQNRTQALLAQSCGLLPRQVFVLLPEGPPQADNLSDEPPNRCNKIITCPETSETATSEVDFADIFTPDPNIRYTSSQINLYKDYFGMKDTATAYNQEIVKVHTHDHWSAVDPYDLEAEFLGVLITKPYTGAPWIPRILIMGPPSAGKRTVAEKLGAKFKIPCFGWIDIVRGALAFEDDYTDEYQMYLDYLTPVSDACVSALLKRRLYREDCLKRGFVLFGFPETANQAAVMDKVNLTPNRIFLLSCQEKICLDRIEEKKKEMLERKIPSKHSLFSPSAEGDEQDGDGGGDAKVPPEGHAESKDSINDRKCKCKLVDCICKSEKVEPKTYREDPYSDDAIQAKFEYYNNNISDVIRHFGSSIMFVDASEELQVVVDFAVACTLRPPNIRFD